VATAQYKLRSGDQQIDCQVVLESPVELVFHVIPSVEYPAAAVFVVLEMATNFLWSLLHTTACHCLLETETLVHDVTARKTSPAVAFAFSAINFAVVASPISSQAVGFVTGHATL
jgi:hypothetical protein